MTRSPAPSLWREAVLELRYAERRRVFPTSVHVGTPGAVRVTQQVPAPPSRGRSERWDQALRGDVLGALLDRHAGTPGAQDAPVTWLTRCGPLGHHDEDAAWLAAAATAYGEAGLDLGLAVVTHAGWYDPRTGQGRTWKRLRRRSRQSQAWTGSLECIRSR